MLHDDEITFSTCCPEISRQIKIDNYVERALTIVSDALLYKEAPKSQLCFD